MWWQNETPTETSKPRKCKIQTILCRWTPTQSKLEESARKERTQTRAKGKLQAKANLVAKSKNKGQTSRSKSETRGNDRACCGRRGHIAKDWNTYGVTEVPTYPQHPLGVRPGQTHPPLLPTQITRMLRTHHSQLPVPSEASPIRAVNHKQTQQAWCLVLQVENNSINSRDRDEGNALVDIAYEVHWTDRQLVEKSDQKTVSSSPPKIIAARKHSLEHCRKSSCIPRLRVGSPPRVRSKRMRSAKPDCLWHRWWTRAIKWFSRTRAECSAFVETEAWRPWAEGGVVRREGDEI